VPFAAITSTFLSCSQSFVLTIAKKAGQPKETTANSSRLQFGATKHANGIPGQHLRPNYNSNCRLLFGCWSAIKFISKVAQLLVIWAP